MAALAYAFTTYFIFLPEKIDWSLLLLVFCATFGSYAFHRIYPILKNKFAFTSKIIAWTKQHLKAIIALWIICLFIVLFTFLQLNLAAKITLFVLALTTLMYSFPIIKSKTGFKRLRDFPFAKIFLIGITWGIVCSTLPLINSGESFSKSIYIFSFLEKCFFIIAITLPFDIRDTAFDKIEKVKTIPTMLGVKPTIILAQTALVISLLIVILTYNQKAIVLTIYGMVYFLTAILIYKSQTPKKDIFYFLYLDGLMILLALSLVFFT